MATDRVIFKQQQAAALGTTAATSAVAEVQAANCRPRDMFKVGTENAATGVTEVACFPINNKSIARSIKYLTQTNIATDTTDYVLITLSKRDSAGVNQTTIATWNTHTSAQGAITANVPAAMSLVTNSDGVIAAGSTVAYTIAKSGAGKVVPIGTFTFDLEEI